MPKLGACLLGIIRRHRVLTSSLLPLSAPLLLILDHVMTSHPLFPAASAEVDAAAIAPLPRSRKVYQQGSQADIRVPFREVWQDDTPSMFGGEKNAPLTI